MTVTDQIEPHMKEALNGLGLSERIARGWGSRRGRRVAPRAGAGLHACRWRLLAYASLPITEGAPEASTLIIEGCCVCPEVRSSVVAGRWVPAALGEMVRVDGGPVSSTWAAPQPAPAGRGRGSA